MVLSARYVHAILVTFWLLYFCFIHTPIYYLVERSLWLDISKANVQQVRFNYSLKNIGLSTNDGYESEIIDKCQDVIQRIRWKAHFFLHQPNTTIQRSNYGLKSKLSAPFVAKLKPFEDDLNKMIKNIKFRPVNDHFMQELQRDKRKKQIISKRFCSRRFFC